MLDDIKEIKRIDTQDMAKAIGSFPDQIEKAMELAEDVELEFFKPSNIIVGGMGGSAIGGDILATLLFRRSRIPIMVNRSYNLPNHAGSDTLLFAVSYSGNTQETYNMVKEGLDRGCHIIAITSGGQLAKLASRKDVPMVKVPSGYQPRAAIGFLFIPILIILKRMGLYDPDVELHEAICQLKDMRDELALEVPEERNLAKSTAIQLKDSMPVIYSHTIYSSIARRWHTQIHENSKAMAWWGVLPEVNHNEIVGMCEDRKSKDIKLVLIRDDQEDPKISSNVEAFKAVLKDKVEIIEICSKGRTYLARMLYAMYLGDWVSYYLALAEGKDPTPVDAIRKMKEVLAKKK